jgi:hypothetical protein
MAMSIKELKAQKALGTLYDIDRERLSQMLLKLNLLDRFRIIFWVLQLRYHKRIFKFTTTELKEIYFYLIRKRFL